MKGQSQLVPTVVGIKKSPKKIQRSKTQMKQRLPNLKKKWKHPKKKKKHPKKIRKRSKKRKQKGKKMKTRSQEKTSNLKIQLQVSSSQPPSKLRRIPSFVNYHVSIGSLN
uniref:Uncharacterized protein n=1 Tax=Cacopsylla melanoneura TaxID=428564 RepID=A0A8D8SGR7_9HEMI